MNKYEEMSLKELLEEKERLSGDSTISDDTFYMLTDIIDNIMVNSYSVEEIDKAMKEMEG